MNRFRHIVITIALLTSTTFTPTSSIAETTQLTFSPSDGQIAIQVNEQHVASYFFEDETISRPFFAHVKTSDGIQVTRNHPPKPGDSDDHATMHPGIWLAFGDIGGADVWRNKATIKHVEFVQQPASQRNMGSFIEKKRYVRPDGTIVCDEEFRFAILAKEDSYRMDFESTFSGENEFHFGDQEEMGWGVRVATGISQIGGGQLTDSSGRSSAKAIWSNAASWCDYSGVVDGRRVGITVMSHPTNFRDSWWHARDYGLITANPFGRHAMNKGETSRIVVRPGESLKLRFAIDVHGESDSDAITTAYKEYARLGK